MRGQAEEIGAENHAVNKYRFTPEEVWINDEAKRGNGSYKHDIRVALDLEALRKALRA